ncbi:uncharacterized protein LOC121835246 [Ixodes scapularis]|uniref:uncharacterized protein LOC121835246 n=1 Tax=Ixodes scapularis TaxID=6945 RepID=UPI001C38EF4B|nr:uncharacterized protein LOC121835246 [Ixodes scapularis]
MKIKTTGSLSELKRWIIAIRRCEGKNFKVIQSTKVCSLHFKEDDFLPGYVNGRKFLKEWIVPSRFKFSAWKVPRRKVHRHSPVPMANTVDTPAVTPDDEADGAAASENQPPPLPEVFALVVELQAKVPEQAAQVSQPTCNLQRAREQLTNAKNEVLKLTRIMKLLEDCNQKLQQKLSWRLSINCFKDRPDDVQTYTGLPNYDAYLSLLQHLNPGSTGENIKMWSTFYSQGSKQGRPRSLPPHDELFLVLVRLRLGLFEKDLAFPFGISTTTVSRLCITWISYLYQHLGHFSLWLTRQEVDEAMPPGFRKKYPTRVILDATEIKCQVPSSLTLQSASFLSYKSTNTFNGLIGIFPDGTVTCASQLFLGSMSDKECVRQSGFLKLPFDEKDSVMADKGFLISDLLEEINVKLNIPPFLGQGTFTEAQAKETENIASLRIHVKRRIQRVKSFHIFERFIPLSLGPVVNEMWAICTVLSNFQNPLLRQHDAGNGD